MKALKIIGLGGGIALNVIFLACLYKFNQGYKVCLYENSLLIIIIESLFFMVSLIGLSYLFYKEIK